MLGILTQEIQDRHGLVFFTRMENTLFNGNGTDCARKGDLYMLKIKLDGILVIAAFAIAGYFVIDRAIKAVEGLIHPQNEKESKAGN